MSDNDTFQLYSKENNKNENILQETKKNTQKKKTRNRTKNKTEDEIKVELIMKNKTESTQDKTKVNDLILPKIENNNTLKQSHENDIKYLSQSNEAQNNKNSKNLTISNENKININNEKKVSTDNIVLNENKIDEIYDTDEQKLVETFNKNKKTLMQVCIEIEENLNRIYLNSNKTNDDNAMNKTQNMNSSNNNNYKISPEQKEIIKKINNYKKRIKTAQEELDMQLKLNKADELENILKERKIYLEKIKKENSILKNIKNLQEKDEKEIKNIQNKKEELYSVNEKINKIKDEAKIKKDYNHTLSEKIKSQNEQINTLKNKCNLINQNIEYFKKKQIHSIQNQNNNIENNNLEKLDLNELKKIYEEKVEIILEKQEKIKNKIKEQNIKIEQLTSDNENLSVNIDKIMMKIKTNMNKILSYEKQLRKKESLLYDSIIKNKRKNTLSDRKPFHIGPINTKPKSKKNFDYQKYLNEYEKNKKKIKLYSSVDGGGSKKSKPKALLEIENLRNDIQLAIKKNELDEKIEKIIHKLKDGKTNKNINININNNNEEDDVLNNLFKKNDEINGSNRYNFYVTEGANLPIPLKQENINNNLNTNF